MLTIDLIRQDPQTSAMLDFIRFAVDYLKIQNLPRIRISKAPISGNESTSFACYRPGGEITIYMRGRHLMDVMRSIAHELVHHRQHTDGVLTPDSGRTGSKHENEANSLAGEIMRRYGRLHPQLFTTGGRDPTH